MIVGQGVAVSEGRSLVAEPRMAIRTDQWPERLQPMFWIHLFALVEASNRVPVSPHSVQEPALCALRYVVILQRQGFVEVSQRQFIAT